MPTSLLVCESCGSRQTFFLDEAVVEEMRKGKTVPRHCLRCRTTTDWVFSREDRRTGRDRRQSADRRTDFD